MDDGDGKEHMEKISDDYRNSMTMSISKEILIDRDYINRACNKDVLDGC